MNTHTDDFDTWLTRHEARPLLRFIACGSVDDGKSTLIGRLLYENGSIFDDQLRTLETDSRRHGTQGARIDYALLLDGLAAEREQGITIDVAWRYFDTEQRKYIVADCPGHAQYTRNMATGASTADLAIVLVDARKGLLAQTRRHSYIVSLFGVRQVVLAVNKMDLTGYDEAVFTRIADEYRALAAELKIEQVTCIPLSALEGDNLSTRSPNMPWYHGPSLIQHLDEVPLPCADASGALRFPVQWVNRPHADFRGFSGTIAKGQVQPGDAVVVLPSARVSTIAEVIGPDGALPQASAGQAVTLTLADELDISRGDVIASTHDRPEVADQFAAHLLWMDDAALLPGRSYWMQIGTRTVSASISQIRWRVDVNTLEHLAARTLELNEVGHCQLSLAAPIAFEAYAHNRSLGGFILIDRHNNATVAAGVIDFALRRAQNLHWQALDVNKAARARLNGHAPKVLWFTGLSGAGKSTLANRVEQALHARGCHTFILDGDNLRHGLNRDLGFTDEDRVENIRRVAEVARLMADAGLIVLVSFISPFRAERQMARERFAEDEFIEIYVDVPLAVAEARDPKGLYRKARAGELPHFTGIDSPYEAPEHPELHLHADRDSLDAMTEAVVRKALE